jgi:hypothetical protein
MHRTVYKAQDFSGKAILSAGNTKQTVFSLLRSLKEAHPQPGLILSKPPAAPFSKTNTQIPLGKRSMTLPGVGR